jgi:hypothetical protein
LLSSEAFRRKTFFGQPKKESKGAKRRFKRSSEDQGQKHTLPFQKRADCDVPISRAKRRSCFHLCSEGCRDRVAGPRSRYWVWADRHAKFLCLEESELI